MFAYESRERVGTHVRPPYAQPVDFDVTTSDSATESLVMLLTIGLPFLLACAAGIVTALKGHWGWLLIGFLFAGLPWLVSAWLPAAPASLWARRRRLDARSG